MELNICHLYPDLLNVYGDVGNILILKYRASKRGINVNVFNVSLNEDFNPDEYDIVFFGGGQDYEQSIVSDDLILNKKAGITNYINSGKVFLAICGGYQLLGKYYTTPDGEKLDGLDILDIRTDGGDTRFIGNTVIQNEATGEMLVGFENHSGRTHIHDLDALGKVIHGFGNNGFDGYEGVQYKNTYGTYFHGSLLSKNPEFADKLIKTALELKYNKPIELNDLDDTLELKAKEYIINRESKTH